MVCGEGTTGGLTAKGGNGGAGGCGGAVGAAALLFHKLPPDIGDSCKVGVVLSGGNMDLDQLGAYGS